MAFDGILEDLTELLNHIVTGFVAKILLPTARAIRDRKPDKVLSCVHLAWKLPLEWDLGVDEDALLAHSGSEHGLQSLAQCGVGVACKDHEVNVGQESVIAERGGAVDNGDVVLVAENGAEPTVELQLQALQAV
ncbi:uncharacterized protein N7515_009644 [Penicillium bovifimosum]|uniref:Uncharacterized protein n=1 Tax=Penicillium bovifimosum TaxID=126998 RepID=A0A9W9GJP5_9EURO|nr:uncharacterized protein N7515_009644 [Penicillium bovifimosum]KAJ5121683.1 hypothetical protein N7515_009644 [Penicillium bovifimosum]